MGPLTYFENWYNTLKPNAWWIARYLPEGIEQEKKLENAKGILDDSKEFLKRSARRHLVTRAIINYGPKRIAAVLAILAVLILSSFGLNEYMARQNSVVLKKIVRESISLAGNRIAPLEDKAILLCENVKLGLITIPEIAREITGPIERVNSIAGMTTAMVVQGRKDPEKEILQGLTVSDR